MVLPAQGTVGSNTLPPSNRFRKHFDAHFGRGPSGRGPIMRKTPNSRGQGPRHGVVAGSARLESGTVRGATLFKEKRRSGPVRKTNGRGYAGGKHGERERFRKQRARFRGCGTPGSYNRLPTKLTKLILWHERTPFLGFILSLTSTTAPPNDSLASGWQGVTLDRPMKSEIEAEG